MRSFKGADGLAVASAKRDRRIARIPSPAAHRMGGDIEGSVGKHRPEDRRGASRPRSRAPSGERPMKRSLWPERTRIVRRVALLPYLREGELALGTDKAGAGRHWGARRRSVR